MTTNFVIGLAILVILVLVAATIALVSMVRGRKATSQSEQPTAKAPDVDSAPPEPEASAPALPDVVARADLAGAPDPLTTLKGLGPKAAAQLNELGITRYAQLAALDAAGVAALDARMGAFKGRIARDRWVEQAAYLAAGDTAAFEATFGKLGGR
jgi:predicted flap endonuclease-1-like 5' DNA nuclease